MAIDCAAPASARSRRRIKYALVTIAVAGMLLVAVGLLVPYSLYRQIGDADIDLDALPARPARSAAAEGAVNVAVLGTIDNRCVSLMVFHIGSNRRDAAFVSVPGSPVCGPAAGPMDAGDPERVALDLEQASGVRLDHLAILDWAAVSRLDAVADGVEVRLDGPAYLPWPNTYLTVTPDNLLDFVGYPISSSDQEPTRIRKQQLVLQNVLRTTLHQEMRKEPWVLYRFLDVVTGDLALDSSWSFVDLSRLTISLRNMRSNDIAFYTVDPASASDVWNAVREDSIGAR